MTKNQLVYAGGTRWGPTARVWLSLCVVAVVSTVAVIGALVLTGEKATAQTPPQGTLDANCDGAVRGFTDLTPSITVGQTFTAVNSGKLTSAQVKIAKQPFANTSGDIIVEIRTVDASGLPTETVLASTTIDDAAITNLDGPSNLPTVTANFDPAIAAPVVAGQQYALVLRLAPMSTGNYAVGLSDRDCPGGQFVQNLNGTFTGFHQSDFVFATFVTVEAAPAPPPPLIPAPGQQPDQQQGGAPAPITQEGEQEAEAGEIDQTFDIS